MRGIPRHHFRRPEKLLLNVRLDCFFPSASHCSRHIPFSCLGPTSDSFACCSASLRTLLAGHDTNARGQQRTSKPLSRKETRSLPSSSALHSYRSKYKLPFVTNNFLLSPFKGTKRTWEINSPKQWMSWQAKVSFFLSALRFSFSFFFANSLSGRSDKSFLSLDPSTHIGVCCRRAQQSELIAITIKISLITVRRGASNDGIGVQGSRGERTRKTAW